MIGEDMPFDCHAGKRHMASEKEKGKTCIEDMD